jgi:hypothetical protein
MAKIGVDVIGTQRLSCNSELKSLNGAYTQLSIGDILARQKQKTKLQLQPGLGTSI